MKNVYEKIGLKKIVNASGRMTALGVSTLKDEVIEVMKESCQNYVVIDDLLEKCGKMVAEYIGSEAACITSSTSAAICLSCAAVMTGTDYYKISKLPDTTGLKNEFVIQGGHDIDFGTKIRQLISVAGGKPVFAGSANLCKIEEVEGCINEKTAALIYVKSHHCVQKGMVSIKDYIEIAHKHKLPLIMDASAEEDLQCYVKMRVDLVCYSGSKAVCGPSSGFVVGKKKYIDAVFAQYKGFGRLMKVGKEDAITLTKAIEVYLKTDQEKYKKSCLKQANYLLKELKDIKGIKSYLQQDEAGRAIYRVKVDVLDTCKYNAKQIVEKLKNGSPSIYVRTHNLNLNSFSFDFRPLIDGDVELIAKAMKRILK